MEIASEDAILAWASEKEGAEEEEKMYLQKAATFIKVQNFYYICGTVFVLSGTIFCVCQWLREADEEDTEEDDEYEEDEGKPENEGDEVESTPSPAGEEEGHKVESTPGKVDDEELLDYLQREMSVKKRPEEEYENSPQDEFLEEEIFEGRILEEDKESTSLPPSSVDFDSLSNPLVDRDREA